MNDHATLPADHITRFQGMLVRAHTLDGFFDEIVRAAVRGPSLEIRVDAELELQRLARELPELWSSLDAHHRARPLGTWSVGPLLVVGRVPASFWVA